MQRIRIEGIRKDPWFRKNYVRVEHREDEEVSLDDVRAVFEDIEVSCLFPFCYVFSAILFPLRNFLMQVTEFCALC